MRRAILRSRSGITFIELLVILAVLLFLLGLLIPAVQKIRGAAARTESLNNLAQMGKAMHLHHDVKKYLPPAAFSFHFETPNQARTGSEVRHIANLPMFGAILPYIEQDQVYRAMTVRDQTWGDPENGGTRVLEQIAVWHGNAIKKGIAIYVNPSDPTPHPGGLYNGLGVAGYTVNETALPEVTHFNRDNQTTTWGRKVNLISGFPDGSSQTVVLAERYVLTYYPFQAFDAAASPGQVNYWHDPNNIRFSKDSRMQLLPSLRGDDRNRASGEHVQIMRPEGILITLADASSRLVSPTVDARTWQNACDPFDGNALLGDW